MNEKQHVMRHMKLVQLANIKSDQAQLRITHLDVGNDGIKHMKVDHWSINQLHRNTNRVHKSSRDSIYGQNQAVGVIH